MSKIYDLLYMRREETKTALIGSEELSYKDWFRLSKQLSQEMTGKVQDIVTKNKIGIFIQGSLEYAVAYFAILNMDKTIVPISAMYTDIEIVKSMSFCELNILISVFKDKERIEKFVSYYMNELTVIYIAVKEGELVYEISEYNSGSNRCEADDEDKVLEDVVIMLQTSGTTKNPKRVMLTNRNLLCNIKANVNNLQLSDEDNTLICLPIYFGYCNTAQFLSHLFVGATMIFYDGLFTAPRFFKYVNRYHITDTTLVPTHLELIKKYDGLKVTCNSLRFICFGGGKISTKLIDSLIEKFPHINFIQTYGMTEAAPRITALFKKDYFDNKGSVGKALEGIEYKIINDKNEQVGEKEIGEIVVKGSNIMKGYYHNEEDTEKTIVQGWLHTGDIGYVDKGYLYIVGRKKNIIISGGINIYVEEVEEAIKEYPNVEDVLIKGRTDEMRGEVPIAFIQGKNVNIEDLKAFCSERLSKYKIPVEFNMVNKIQKTYNGKTLRSSNNIKEQKMKKEIFERVCNIIKESMDVLYSGQLTEDTDLVEDLQFDSVNLIEFIVRLETEFEVVLDDEIMLDDKLKNLGGIVEIIYNRMNESGDMKNANRF